MAAEKATAQEVFDGVMLSDGSLKMRVKDAFFSIDLSGIDHIDWLYAIKDALTALDIPFGPSWPRLYKSKSRGKTFYGVWLESLSCPTLTVQYSRWYPKGIKTVPSDVWFSAITLAHWFMGDGSSSFGNVKGYTQDRYIRASFATDKFTYSEVGALVDSLRLLGLKHARRARSSKGYYDIHIQEMDSVRVLMEIVTPYICESYRYKIKTAAPYGWRRVGGREKAESTFGLMKQKLRFPVSQVFVKEEDNGN